ncbi:MAG: hypothetical protein U0930_12160 [Pirellulales bacterium]
MAHPQLDPYREMRHRNWTWVSGLFIAEGPLLAERLAAKRLWGSACQGRASLCRAVRRLGTTETPVLVVEHDNSEQLVGFNFHRVFSSVRIQKAIFGDRNGIVYHYVERNHAGLVRGQRS